MRRFSKAFPVDDDFFAPLHLPQQRLDGLRTEVRNALHSALAECNKLQTTRENVRMPSWPLWKVQAQFEGLSAYARVHDLAPTVSSSRVCGTVPGNYMDIARFFKSDTREKYFNVQKRLFPDVVDAAVLHTVQQRTNHPNVSEGIKWAAYTPSWRRNPMDECVFEATGTGVGSDGRSYFYRVVIPTAFAEVPELSTSKRTVRAQCKSVMILSPSAHDDNSSDVFMTMRSDFKDHRMPRGFYKRLLTGLRNVGAVASVHNAPTFILCHNKWVLRDLQRACDVCSREFSVLRTKHQCTLCGEAVCRKCLLQGESLRSWRGRSAHGSLLPTKACKLCVKRLREEDAQGTPLLGGGFSTCDAVTPTVRTRKEPRFASEWTRKSSDPEWVTAPNSRMTYDEWDRSIESESDDDLIQARISALSSQSFYSISPVSTIVDDEASHEGPIYEDTECSFDEDEDDESLVDFSASSSSVFLTIDTREMKRVSSLRDVPDFGAMSPSSSPSLFQSIGSSLREQSKLLRQIQRAAGRSVRRNTRGCSSVYY